MKKVGRALAALILAYSPFLWPLSSSAIDSVQNAQAAVDSAILEQSEAQSSKAYADALVDSATVDRDAALSDVIAAQLDYDNSNIEISRNTTDGLTARSFNTFGTPLRSLTAHQQCAVTLVAYIYDFWPQGCNQDGMIHFSGTMTPTITGRVWFLGQSDDGMQVIVNGQTVSNNWTAQGCGANNAGFVSLTAGTPYPFEVWFFDSGGPSCAHVYYRLDSHNFWQEIPATWFSGTTIVYGKDPELLAILNDRKAILANKQSFLDSAISIQSQANLTLQAVNANVAYLEQSLATAIANRDAVIAAEEAARLEAEGIEAARLAAEAAAAAEAARLEAEKLEADRLEAERLAAAEEAERQRQEALAEAERQAAIEAARLEAERLAEIARLEAEAAARAAAEEADRLEAERIAAEQARAEAEEKARQEAEANKPIPTPQPTPSVTLTPTPTPTTPQPSPSPTPNPSTTPNPEPIVPEEPTIVDIKTPVTAENITAVVEELATIQPQQLTEEQQTLIVEAALETFETAEQGSEEYEAALDALLVVAQADDIILDEELAAIPLIGNVAGAAVEVFNALGNAGADMSPQVREQSEKVVVASVIVANIAITATSAATSAAAVAARRP